MSVLPVYSSSEITIEENNNSLIRMYARFKDLVSKEAITDGEFVEISAILDNVSYIFLYLQSNSLYVNFEKLLPWRDRFFADSDLDKKLLSLVENLSCPDLDVESARLAYGKFLANKIRQNPSSLVSSGAESLQEAKDILTQMRVEETAFLKLVGVTSDTARPDAAFFSLLSATDSAERRQKLGQVWLKVRAKLQSSLIDVVENMIVERRKAANSQGQISPIVETFGRCSVSVEQAGRFIEKVLTTAVDYHKKFEADLLKDTSAKGDVGDHFGFYLRRLRANHTVPMLDLNECLEYIFKIAKMVFGIDVKPTSGLFEGNPSIIRMDAFDDGTKRGEIHFDLWNMLGTKLANTTTGIRNRTEWGSVLQLPVAYVSCRFVPQRDGSNRITFQNAHSLFHEFGHAINHILIHKRLPNQSGLEYLPLERLEDLSMWFEKWIFHREFEHHLSLNANELVGLNLSRHIKVLEYRRTNLERALTAALDFEVHRNNSISLRQAYCAIRDKFDIQDLCRLEDLASIFTWPMLMANPGAYFAYLWGASYSADQFKPFENSKLDSLQPYSELRPLFLSCFDPDQPSAEPTSDSVFQFYSRDYL